ncbi:MAG TPA: sulfatase-like hydrolase/transferase, partial [Rubrobacteraceae bacterium]|nr:sulfatase-like hydrolase/transferase [Rubrobacteraceae bacterium]
MSHGRNEELNVPGFSRALLNLRDRVYLLSLLIPFVVYRLALNALDLASLPGGHSLDHALELVQSDTFFSLGYVLLWIGLFAAVKKGPLRWVVVFLFHLATILVLVVFTFAHQYSPQSGTTLEYGTFAERIPKLTEVSPILLQGAPPLTRVLLTVALFYMALGPWLLTLALVWRRGWQRSSPAETTAEAPFLNPLALCLLGFGFGSLSVLISTSALAKDPFVNVITTGVEEAPTETQAEEATTKEDSLDAGAAIKAAAHATLARTPQTEKRNVVLVHLESTRARSVTPYNEELKTTPFLDELAKQSLLVEQAHVGSIPRSSMSNVSVNCGIQPPPRPGPDEPGSMPVPCLAGLLRDQGYSSAFFSSNADEYGDLATKNWGYEKAFAPPGPSVPSQYWDTSMDPQKYTKPSHYGYEEDIMLEPSERWLKEHKDGPFIAEYMTNT